MKHLLLFCGTLLIVACVTQTANGFELCSLPSQSAISKLKKLHKLKKECHRFLKQDNKKIDDLCYWISFINKHHLNSKINRIINDHTIIENKGDALLCYCYTKDHFDLFKTLLVYGCIPGNQTKSLLVNSQNTRAGAYVQAIFDFSVYPHLEQDEHKQFNLLIDNNYMSRSHPQIVPSLKKLSSQAVIENFKKSPKHHPLSLIVTKIPADLRASTLQECLLQIPMSTLLYHIKKAKSTLSSPLYSQFSMLLDSDFNRNHARKFNTDRYYTEVYPQASDFKQVYSQAKKICLKKKTGEYLFIPKRRR